MGYKAKDRISALDYEFMPHADLRGLTPEPDPDQIQAYWSGLGNMIRRNRNKLQEWENRLQELKPEDTDARAVLDEQFDAWQNENAVKTLETRRKLLAMVCSNQPSEEDLAQLKGRPFDDLEKYMQGELSPLGATSDTSS